MSELTDIRLAISSDGTGTANGDGRKVVAVSGEIDLTTCTELRSAITGVLDEGAPEVVVDVSGVAFIDATGIGVLIGVTNKARDAGCRLTLRRPSRAVQRLVDLLNLDVALALED